MSDELSQSVVSLINGTGNVATAAQPTVCVLCRRMISSDHEVGELEPLSMCGDCKFLLLEDMGSPTWEGYQRRRGLRRRRHNSSEHVENIFSQHFSLLIDQARNNPSITPGYDNQSLNSDVASRLSQHISLHTTPSGSRRWRRAVSDTESDGFGSLYGESESNISYSGHRHFHGDSDALSYSAYGGDSGASVDGHSVLEYETFVHADGGSDFDPDTDTDIDPMNAGMYQWDSDDYGEEDEDNEWEAVNDVESMHDSWRVRALLQRSMIPNDRRAFMNWQRGMTSLEFDGITHFSIGEMRRTQNADISLEGAEAHNNDAANYEDFRSGRGFEELLERLGEDDISRRGAPPAAVSFVKDLPRILINKDDENVDDLVCAVCKDSLSVGSIVNQLPCLHVYHPPCIIPWLSARNSCPLCRYELPTDDKDYENRKQMGGSGLDPHEIRQQDLHEDSSSDLSEGAEIYEQDVSGNGRTSLGELPDMNDVAVSSIGSHHRRSLFQAAAGPIVSIAGMVLVVWLGNSLSGRILARGRCAIHDQSLNLNASLGSCPSNRRVDGGRRRWWSIF